MIKNVIYVEDGSVDVDELQETVGEETKVIVYRAGSKPPEIVQLSTPINTVFDDKLQKVYNKIVSTREHFNELYVMNKTQQVDRQIKAIYDILFEGIDF